MVGVEVGHEDAGQLLHLEPGFSGAPDHARSAIHQIDAIVRYHRHGRSHALRFGIGSAGPEQNDVRILRPCGGAQQE